MDFGIKEKNMIAETKKGGVLTPGAGKYMYSEKEGVVSDRVHLGKEDDGSGWREITEAEKIAIEGERQSALL